MEEREYDLQQSASLLLNLLPYDCTLLVGPEATPFKAHKLRLTMASPVFESMLMTDSAEQDTYSITDVEPKLFGVLLNYINTKNIIITTFKDAHELYMLANQYLIHQLARVCAEYMISNVTEETVFEAYEAGTKCQDQALIYESIQELNMNISNFLLHKSFEDMDIEKIAEIFSIEKLKVDEMALYRALERRVQAHSSRKRCSSPVTEESGIEAIARRSVRKALKHIRFLTFTLEEFAGGPARSGLFTKSEALAILLNIAKAEGVPMPPGFSTNTTRRFQRPVMTPAMINPQPVSSGVLRLTMSKFTTSAMSPLCVMLKKPWVLKVIPYYCNTLNVYQATPSLSVFLKCGSTDNIPWACVARVDFKLLAAKCGKQDHVKHMQKTFTNLDKEFGIDAFVSVYNASNEDNGYLGNGQVTFEASVILEPILGKSSSQAATSSAK